MTTTGTDKYDLVLHCTGFGPFSGVPENPTSMLMQTLPSQLSLGDTPLPPSVKCASFTVLETSFQGSRSQLDEIYETGLLASNGGHTIYLHIGMHFLLSNSLHCLAWFSESETWKKAKLKAVTVTSLFSGTTPSHVYNLEACAYNELNYCVPDERGFQPRSGKVREEDVLGMVRETGLPTDELVEKMRGFGWNEAFVKKVCICSLFSAPSLQGWLTSILASHNLYRVRIQAGLCVTAR